MFLLVNNWLKDLSRVHQDILAIHQFPGATVVAGFAEKANEIATWNPLYHYRLIYKLIDKTLQFWHNKYI